MKVKTFQPTGGYFKYAAEVGSGLYFFAKTERSLKRQVNRALKAEARRIEIQKDYDSG